MNVYKNQHYVLSISKQKEKIKYLNIKLCWNIAEISNDLTNVNLQNPQNISQ